MTALTSPSTRLGLRARLAEEADTNFLCGLAAEADGRQFSVLGLSDGPVADDEGFEECFILERHGRSIGRLIVDRAVDAIVIADLRVLEGERGRGAGTWAVRGVMSDAVALDQPVVTHVLRANRRGRAWLRGLGFRTIGADGLELRVEWVPPRDVIVLE